MYDLIIIGSGPAGYTAAIYAARYKLNTLLIGALPGGVMSEAHLVENWPGTNSITGHDLTMNFENHVKYFDVPINYGSVTEVSKQDNIFKITTSSDEIFESKTILIASGTKKKKLGVVGEAELRGKGVSYCATCDGFFFKNKVVAVVGGNDSAGTAALLLADHAEKIYLIYRGEELRCEDITRERVKKNQKIEIIYNTNVTKINGENSVESLDLDKPYNGSEKLEVKGIFIEIGATPLADLAKKLNVELDENEKIKINQHCETNITGAYSAGDIAVGLFDLRQIITAAASGAIAATSVNKFIKS
jgi:thioredoxin reductase (NADPH)